MRIALATAALAVALAGCGGETTAGAGPSAADVVPADIAGYFELDSDLDSEQWERVQALLDRFPDQPKLLDLLNGQLEDAGLEYERDVAPALGPSVAVLFTSDDDQDAVLLTQPDDEDKWRALVEKAAESEDEEYVLGEIEGWQAVAMNQAVLDAVKNGGGSLAENDAYQAALAELPEERIALAWASGDVLEKRASEANLEWFAFAAEAQDDGAAATIVTRSSGAAGEEYTSERLDQAPADAIAFLSLDADGLRTQAASFAPLAGMLGLGLDELLAQLRGEAAVWVRLRGVLPEVTLVADVDDPQAAEATLRRLLRDAPLQFRFGVVGGALVATTAASPEAALETGGSTLAGSPDFEDARETAGMPGETAGFLYVNVADALPLFGVAPGVPPEIAANLRPLRSVVAWSEVDGSVGTHHLFVQIQ